MSDKHSNKEKKRNVTKGSTCQIGGQSERHFNIQTIKGTRQAAYVSQISIKIADFLNTYAEIEMFI